MISIMIVTAVLLTGWFMIIMPGKATGREGSILLFVLYFAAYIFISYSVTGAFKGEFHLNHHLYVVNLIVIMVLLGRKYPAFLENPVPAVNDEKWLQYTLSVIALIFLLALIAISIHGELDGARNRFPVL